MATKGITIPLTLNPAALIRGLRVSTEAMDKLAGAVDDVADAGDDAADALDDLGDTRADIDQVADAVDDTADALDDVAGTRRDIDQVATALDDVADEGGDAADALDDVAGTRRDIDQVATALDDVADEGGDAADALDDVASTRRDIDQVATALDDVADESGDAEKAFGDLARGARRDLGRVGDAADTAERDVDDLTDEVGSSAREFGSAFRGDPIEALEEVQSLTSELATRFIPGIGGAVAAVTGGVVFSALIGFYERWKEEQEAINERVRGFRDEVVDALGVLDTSVIKEALVDQLDQAGVSASELETILAAAPEELRVGFRTALQSGDLQGLLDLSEEIDDAAANINQNFVAQGSSLTPGQKAVLDLNKALGGTVGELYDGVTEAQSLGRVLGNDVTDAAEDAEDAIDDASRDRNTTIDVDVAGVTAAQQTLNGLTNSSTKVIRIDWQNTQLPAGIASAGRIPGRAPR